jgi:hypothetical protein
MPLLFYGNIGLSKERVLYTEKWAPISTGIYDSLKLDDLAPYRRNATVFNYWWLRHTERPHSCIAWNGMHGNEQLVLIPGLMKWRKALVVARETFGTAMPSAIVFRMNNKKRPYLYD